MHKAEVQMQEATVERTAVTADTPPTMNLNSLSKMTKVSTVVEMKASDRYNNIIPVKMNKGGRTIILSSSLPLSS